MFLARLAHGSSGLERAAKIRGERRMLLTDDGIRVAAHHLPPAAAAADPGLVVVIAHGFTLSSQHPAVRRIADWLTESVGVVLVDLRGHGNSAGQSTVGWREVLDVDAAVRWAWLLGYERVATLGFSLGSAVVLRQAALFGDVDAVVAVSGPAQWYYRGTRPMRLLHHAVLTPHGRAVLRAVRRTTISPNDWTRPYPLNPAEAAARITPPLLIVHGDLDPYFPVEHGMRLHEMAQPPKDLWILEGFRHAESAVDVLLSARIAHWLSQSTERLGRSAGREAWPHIVGNNVNRDLDGEEMWLG